MATTAMILFINNNINIELAKSSDIDWLVMKIVHHQINHRGTVLQYSDKTLSCLRDIVISKKTVSNFLIRERTW